MGRAKNYLRPFLSYKFLICFFLAWLITNGWSYAFIIVGLSCDIEWMSAVGLGYQAFLWLPFTPEKLVTIPMAMWFNARIFKDEKNKELLTNMKQQAIQDWKKLTSKIRKKKQNIETNIEEENKCQD